ncbi:MAG TPA: SufD family Fe-S cluster assembly protein [Allosphingosinicella sp.]|nr:SufD family Fe-S cluster assembly protein [Allosphingosinicella sp.]
MKSLVLPSNRTEGWRWSDLSRLPEFAESEPTRIAPEVLPWLDIPGPRLLFVDGRLDHSRSDPGPVEIGDVDGEAIDHPLARHAGRHGWKLILGPDHATADPVQIVHATTGAADHLAAEILLGSGAQASILETFVGAGWANRATSIRLAKGARLMLNRRALGDTGFISLTDQAAVGEGASFVSVCLAAGGRDTRLDAAITLTGTEAYAEAGGALLARGRQRHDINLVLRHDQPAGMSRQLWRSVADDMSACSVAARVEVARDAQKTDGEQSLKGILLSRGATINAKPELEIFADDVKCAHGATVGELDRNALFYLESRGISPDDATALLTRAFVADALDRIGEEAVRAAFYDDGEAWFGGRE